MTDERRLILHIGMPKTGSSALQVALVRNRTWLHERGVYYPPHSSDKAARRGEVVSGNGVGPHRYLANEQRLMGKERPDASVFTRRLAESEAYATLFSSESFWGFHPSESRFELLREELASRRAGLQIVVFVRDVVGHALSAYSQRVKRARYTGSFDAFIRQDEKAVRAPYQQPVRERIEHLVNVLGSENVHVLYYDSHRKDLVRYFLRSVFGIEDFEGFDASTSSVNRSLTSVEIEMMRRINGRMRNQRDATAISNAIISMPAFGAKELTISPSNLAELERRFTPDVQWVNDTFFGGADVLKVESEAVRVGEPSGGPGAGAFSEDFYLNLIGELAPRTKL